MPSVIVSCSQTSSRLCPPESLIRSQLELGELLKRKVANPHVKSSFGYGSHLKSQSHRVRGESLARCSFHDRCPGQIGRFKLVVNGTTRTD